MSENRRILSVCAATLISCLLGAAAASVVGGFGTLGAEHDNPCELRACVVREGQAISDRR